MLYNLVIVTIYFVEMLISYYFFSAGFEKKLTPLYCMLIGTAVFELGAFFDIILSNIVWFNSIFFIVINLAFCLLCFKITVTKGIIYAVIIEVFSAGLEFASIFIISILTKTETTAYVDDISFLILDSSVSKILLLFVLIILARFIKENKNPVKLPILTYVFPVLSIIALIVFWDICANGIITDSQKLSLSILSAALLFSTVMLFISYQHRLEKDSRVLALEKEMEKVESDKKYYEILEKQNEELMIYAHDTKNHLEAIRELNDNKQIEKYITQMADELKTHTNTCLSGNHTLDVIINKYVTECKIKNISFTFDVKSDNLQYVKDFDLVSILGNVLDNALEAAAKTNGGAISLVTTKRNNFDVIIVSNTCDIPPDKDLKSTKANSRFHGLGMKSVAKAIKKYDGYYDWEYNPAEKQFTITIVIPNSD